MFRTLLELKKEMIIIKMRWNNTQLWFKFILRLSCPWGRGVESCCGLATTSKGNSSEKLWVDSSEQCWSFEVARSVGLALICLFYKLAISKEKWKNVNLCWATIRCGMLGSGMGCCCQASPYIYLYHSRLPTILVVFFDCCSWRRYQVESAASTFHSSASA